MRFALPICLLTLVAAAGMTMPVLAAPADDFKAAYAAAEAASKQAAAMKTQWTTTVATLKAAQAAATAGKYDEAIALAKQAQALAEASIAQAKDQATAWKGGVIR
jgi:ATP/maltotriose-dependent transcriptional regulator MalT